MVAYVTAPARSCRSQPAGGVNVAASKVSADAVIAASITTASAIRAIVIIICRGTKDNEDAPARRRIEIDSRRISRP